MFLFDTILFGSLFLGYLFYIEFSPGMGNIWIRNGRFNPYGAWYMMISPLSKPFLWRREFVDINFFCWIIVGLCIKFLVFITTRNSIQIYTSTT